MLSNLTFKPFIGLSDMLAIHDELYSTQFELEMEEMRDRRYVGADPEFVTYVFEIRCNSGVWSYRKIRR